MNELLLIFIVLNVINVVLQTFKVLCTVNSGKWTAAIVNAVAYGFYTVVVIYMLCDLSTWVKALIIGVCNLIGVYIVKLIEEKKRKDKLWKIEFAIKEDCLENITSYLIANKVPYNKIFMQGGYVTINAFCNTQKESEIVKKVITKYNAKYFVSESKSLY